MSGENAKNESGMFSTGLLTDPQPGDSRFEKLDDAVNAAIAGSKDDDVWAVWEDDSGEILSVVYQQQVFTP